VANIQNEKFVVVLCVCVCVWLDSILLSEYSILWPVMRYGTALADNYWSTLIVKSLVWVGGGA